MRKYDRLFAISEATRQDTIRIAGVDPSRIHVLPGDIDDRKKKLFSILGNRSAAQQYGLASPYAVYVGGADWRKNQEGLIREFGSFIKTHPDWSLAIICAMPEKTKQACMDLARESGICSGHLVCTGLVSDETLTELLAGAEVMVFPSFYEGLGLPILESYAAGTPVLGSDNSSIRDLVHPLCRFDPHQPGCIKESLETFISHPEVASASLEYGRALLSALGWDRSASIMTKGLADLPAAPVNSDTPLLAVIGCLPPAESGIAGYNLRYLQSTQWITHFFSDLPPTLQRQHQSLPGLLSGNRVFPSVSTALALRRNGYSHAIFVLGNSSHNVEALNALLDSRFQEGPPCWVYLHEADLSGLWQAHFDGNRTQVEQLYRMYYTEHRDPKKATADANTSPHVPQGIRPLIQMVRPNGILVNSRACQEMIRKDLGPSLAAEVPIEILFNPIEPPTQLFMQQKCVPKEELAVGHFGVLGDQKQPQLMTRAIARLAKKRKVSLTLAGFGTRQFCSKRRLDRLRVIRILDSPSAPVMNSEMSKIDVAVQLRFPTLGESSAAVGELIALGKPVIVTDVGSYAEYPDSLVTKISPLATVEDLVVAIEKASTAQPDSAARMAFLSGRSPEAFASRLGKVLGLPDRLTRQNLSVSYPDESQPSSTFQDHPLSHNKVCNLEDFAHPSLLPVIQDVFSHELDRFGAEFPKGYEYRKYWEIAMAVRAFQDGGVLRQDAEILGVGAGNEPTTFYLTNHVRRVFATDLYLAEGWEESANASMLTQPERHWPFQWKPKRLVVQHMNGMELRYEDECMDGVFSSSSIEHFGDWRAIEKALSEIHRVLKPGGIASISTEYLVTGPKGGWPGLQFFDSEAIQQRVLDAFDWDPVSPLDFSVSEPTMATEASFDEVARDQKHQTDVLGGHFTFLITYARYPHILLRLGGRTFTSIHLALRKR